MDNAAFEKYLTERYYDQMDYYNKNSRKKQVWYKSFQWILIVLSALAPVLAALNGAKFDTNIFVVVISSIVAILTTGLKTFDYQELWVKYRSTFEKLKPEIHYYEFNIGPYAGNDINKQSLFVTRVELILDTEHNQWPIARNLQDGKSSSGQANTEVPARLVASGNNGAAKEEIGNSIEKE